MNKKNSNNYKIYIVIQRINETKNKIINLKL